MTSLNCPMWRCFHCDEIFTEEYSARKHFGDDESATPACKIKGSEGGLLEALRSAERDAAQAHQSLALEDSNALRAWRNSISRWEKSLRTQEELGYERGMRDMREQVERLQYIVGRYAIRHGEPEPKLLSEAFKNEWREAVKQATDNAAETL